MTQEPTRPLPWSAPRAHELEMQLDDTNVREAQDRDDAIFNEVAARQDTTQT